MVNRCTIPFSSIFVFLILMIAACSPSAIPAAFETSKERIFFNGADSGPDSIREIFVAIGGQAMLECEAGGTPAPLIHWLRNGQRIDQGGAVSELVVGEEALAYENTETNRHLSTLQLSATKSRLFIDCISPLDAGIYVCVAETPTRRIAIEYRLKIDTKTVWSVRMRRHKRNLHKHNIKDHGTQSDDASNKCFKDHHEPARIYMWTLQRVEVDGADVQLYCRPTGSGPVKVTWFDRNGDAISKQEKQYQVQENGDLIVKSINFAENMGLYRCIAENSYGSDTVETFLYPAATERSQK